MAEAVIVAVSPARKDRGSGVSGTRRPGRLGGRRSVRTQRGPCGASPREPRELEISRDRLNVSGRAIALSHRFNMPGVRITSTLLNTSATHDETIGLEIMGVGGGQGMALIVERLSLPAESRRPRFTSLSIDREFPCPS